MRRVIQEAKNLLHALFPLLGATRFGIPGKRLEIIGITGTDGKSSSVILCAAMLRAAGHKVAHYSSISYHDGNTEYPNELKMTTPGRMRLHEFMRRAQKNGCTHAVVEITSQGIIQYRHRFIGFSLVGITNITPEHIEAHHGYGNYQKAKISLVRQLRSGNRGVVIDADTYSAVKNLFPKDVEAHTVRLGVTGNRVLDGSVVGESPHGIRLELIKGGKAVTIATELGGPFIARNIFFAATIAALCGVALESIRIAVENIHVIPGRFEVIAKEPLVIVDYAHTLNALSQILPYVRACTQGTMVHVFGAAGSGRDRYKRPLLAEYSEKYADVSILTEENSFDEPVEAILDDVRKGFSNKQKVYVISHREDAVRFAQTLVSRPGDTLLLTAKGSETVIAGPKRTMRPYNERTYTKWLFETSSSA